MVSPLPSIDVDVDVDIYKADNSTYGHLDQTPLEFSYIYVCKGGYPSLQDIGI